MCFVSSVSGPPSMGTRCSSASGAAPSSRRRSSHSSRRWWSWLPGTSTTRPSPIAAPSSSKKGRAMSIAAARGMSRSSTTSPSRTTSSTSSSAAHSRSRNEGRRSRSIAPLEARWMSERTTVEPTPLSSRAGWAERNDRLAAAMQAGPVTEAPTETGIPVSDPATGETIATVPELGAEAGSRMVAAARGAQPTWAAIGFEGRAEVLLAARDWMAQNAERVVTTIVGETGRPADETQYAELSYGLSALEFWPKMAPHYLADEEIASASPFVRGRRLVVRYAPLGVIGVIGPWNYPLNNSFGDCIPALAAGNAVVLKPSEITPLTSLLMAEMLAECELPEGVFQVATGRGETGAALVDAVDMVMFTGSVATGKRVMAQAAETLTPVSLELGGKDPMIVLADADIERAANAAVSYGMNNAGQVCISVERVYVEDPVYDEFLERVAGKVDALRQGPPGAAGSVDVGAIIFGPQLELIEAHVRDAVSKGAKVVTGGKRADAPSGRFFEPTVLADVDHSMPCMKEETFGPTLPLMRVGDAEEAVRLANDGPYGLQASVWTRDTEKGERLARRVEAGGCCVTDAPAH